MSNHRPGSAGRRHQQRTSRRLGERGGVGRAGRRRPQLERTPAEHAGRHGRHGRRPGSARRAIGPRRAERARRDPSRAMTRHRAPTPTWPATPTSSRAAARTRASTPAPASDRKACDERYERTAGLRRQGRHVVGPVSDDKDAATRGRRPRVNPGVTTDRAAGDRHPGRSASRTCNDVFLDEKIEGIIAQTPLGLRRQRRHGSAAAGAAAPRGCRHPGVRRRHAARRGARQRRRRRHPRRAGECIPSADARPRTTALADRLGGARRRCVRSDQQQTSRGQAAPARSPNAVLRDGSRPGRTRVERGWVARCQAPRCRHGSVARSAMRARCSSSRSRRAASCRY